MKKALIFGFNHYVSQSSLRGCVNDAVSVDLLLREKFEYQTKLIVDELVDSQNFIATLRDLLSPEPDEVEGSRVLYYAGHGFHCYDVAPIDEGDGLDELLCLPAYSYNDPASFVVDDQIAATLDEAAAWAPWLKVFVVLDSCHSGTAIHGIQPGWTTVEALIKQVFKVQSPLEVKMKIDDPRLALAAVAREAQVPIEDIVWAEQFAPSPIANDVGGLSAVASRGASLQLLLSGCSQNQTCKELVLEGTYHGIFSYFLCQLATEDPNITWADLKVALNKNISPSFDQNPQLEGPDSMLSASIF